MYIKSRTQGDCSRINTGSGNGTSALVQALDHKANSLPLGKSLHFMHLHLELFWPSHEFTGRDLALILWCLITIENTFGSTQNYCTILNYKHKKNTITMNKSQY